MSINALYYLFFCLIILSLNSLVEYLWSRVLKITLIGRSLPVKFLSFQSIPRKRTSGLSFFSSRIRSFSVLYITTSSIYLHALSWISRSSTDCTGLCFSFLSIEGSVCSPTIRKSHFFLFSSNIR